VTRLVLVGGGHAHARVLLDFAQRPTAMELVLVTPITRVPYSGMVPGWLAGHYHWDECCVDFAWLCERSGARLVLRSAAGLDAARCELLLDDGSRLPYDLLSLDIGSTLNPPQTGTGVLPMRPLSELRARWDGLLDAIRCLEDGSCHRVLMVGGGAAGVESVLAAAHRLRALAPEVRFAFSLVTHGDALLSRLAGGAGRRLRTHLARQGIELVTGFNACQLRGNTVIAADGRTLDADTVLWATGAEAWAWPAAAGLACDERGFVQVDARLRSVSHKNVFASGDCAGMQPSLAKAGVYAVRMGPVLADNLRAAGARRPLRPYRAQRRFLVLIGSGGPHAVAAWGPLAWQGDWVWRWKQRIDRRFVARHRAH
jgi:pyridine nucleotide-disulfide oxidoreductase family protein